MTSSARSAINTPKSLDMGKECHKTFQFVFTISFSAAKLGFKQRKYFLVTVTFMVTKL